MRCLFDHNWSWPRKRGDRHIQICLDCGSERESKVAFDGPRYTQTQAGHSEPTELVPRRTIRDAVRRFRSVA